MKLHLRASTKELQVLHYGINSHMLDVGIGLLCAVDESLVCSSMEKPSFRQNRQAMIHYRTLLEELVSEPEMARAKSA
jgi:hypothetical protein